MCLRLSCVIRLPTAAEAHPFDAEASGARGNARKQKDEMMNDTLACARKERSKAVSDKWSGLLLLFLLLSFPSNGRAPPPSARASLEAADEVQVVDLQSGQPAGSRKGRGTSIKG